MFLKEHFHHWLEALSLIGKASHANQKEYATVLILVRFIQWINQDIGLLRVVQEP